MSILAASGDIGGGRALLAVLEELASRDRSFSIIENGFLAKNFPVEWHRIPADLKVIEGIFANGQIKVFVFTSSVKDTLALHIARIAKKHDVYIIHLLDNWMNYRLRLEMDGQTMLVPDKYVVMDALAFEEACADGIPRSALEIAGQPALASLGESFYQWNDDEKCSTLEQLDLNKEKNLIAFISEPVEADQGSRPESPEYRGYTEKTVLRELCARLQAVSDKYQLVVIPHPKEDINEVGELWHRCRGNLEGSTKRFSNGRKGILLADGVAGMASILLYEAWLINKPVISLQPNLLKPQLRFMEKRDGAFCVTKSSDWDNMLRRWLQVIDSTDKPGTVKSDLVLHIQAPKRVAQIVIDYLKVSDGAQPK